MTSWVFEGTALPADNRVRLVFGKGQEQPLPGRFGIRGLVDSHCHLTFGLDQRGPLLYGRHLADERLEELAQAGVSAVRDVGGERSVTLELARNPEDGRPLVLAAGRFLAPEGRYFPRVHQPVPAEDLVDAVKAELDDGASWVKLIGDFPAVGPDGPIRGSAVKATYEFDLIEKVVEAAHGRGGRVAAHTTSDVVSDLVRVGVDSVEHGTSITAADLEVLGARGGAWTPTLSASQAGSPDDPQDVVDRRQARSEYLATMLPIAIQYGVRVLAGSDVVGTVAGEVDMLVRHGLTVTQALEAASTSAQEYLGLTPGNDLVTYEVDPREHPAVLATPAAVILGGRRIR